MDTDGDGVEDVVTPADGSSNPTMTIARASGDLVLAAEPSLRTGLQGAYAPSLVSPGDVDGDGRSDLLVMTLDERGFETGFYLVPGSTPAGTYHPADVGVLLSDDHMIREFYAVGDYDEDGADDLAFHWNDSVLGATHLLSGPQVAAPGPGGTLPLGSIQPIASQLGSHPVGVVRLMSDVVAIVMAGNSPGVGLWARGGFLGFSLGFDQYSYPPGINVAVADGPAGERWLVADVFQRFRGVRYVWDLDHPCGTPAAPA